VAFSSDGTNLAIGTGVLNGSDGAVVLDLASGEQLASFPGHKTHIIALAFSADGRTLTTANYTGVRRWDLSRGKERNAWPVSRDVSTPTITLSPEGKSLALVKSSVGDRLHVFELGEEMIPVLSEESQDFCTRVALAPDGRRLAAAYAGGLVRMWDLDRKRERSPLRGSNNWITALALSPDGQNLAAGSRDGTVEFWDVAAADCGGAQAHAGSIGCLAFSPDGRTLASGGEDHTVRLWDVAGGVEHAVLYGHSDSVNAVAFAPDGRSLASASSDKTVRLWRTSVRWNRKPRHRSSSRAGSAAPGNTPQDRRDAPVIG
jgi:WD40 repeat protein